MVWWCCCCCETPLVAVDPWAVPFAAAAAAAAASRARFLSFFLPMAGSITFDVLLMAEAEGSECLATCLRDGLAVEWKRGWCRE